MNAIVFVIIAIACFFLSYRFYSKFLAEKIWKLDSKRVTPARQFNDGFEYVPTKWPILWGHHFSSIAGAAPIVGPIVAAIWGWLPALIWIILGTMFMGAVHDFGTLVTSLRHEGREIADYLKDLMGSRASLLMYVTTFFVLVLVSAVFIHVIAVLLSEYPASVWSVWIEVPLALIIGCVVRHKLRANMVVATLVAVAIMYVMILVGIRYPLTLSYNTWVIILLVYVSVAARLPVWLLVQARDYINFHELIIAIGILTIAIFALGPDARVVAPVVRIAPQGAPPIWPFVMIVISCGAISGWHAIVSSGTSSKQIENEQDARRIGYGAMLGEGYLSVIALITAVVGLSVAGYAKFYGVWGEATWPVIWAEGGSNILGALRIPGTFAAALMAVVAVSFAMTTVDSAGRLTRIAVAECAKTFNAPKIFQNRTVSLIPGFVIIALLAFPWAKKLPYGMTLWPLFGATNQIMAGLALLAAAAFLMMLGRKIRHYIIPFIIVIITAMIAMGYDIVNTYVPKGQWPLAVIGIIVFLCAIGILVLAYQLFVKVRKSSHGLPHEQNL